jgi:hypothetical protein
MSLVEKLGHEFVRRGMSEQAKQLRIYYWALGRGLVRPSGHSLELRWTQETIREWLAVLRVPPYEEVYEVRPPDSRCAVCAAKPASELSRAGTYTLLVFPGGWKSACSGCGKAWLTLESERGWQESK